VVYNPPTAVINSSNSASSTTTMSNTTATNSTTNMNANSMSVAMGSVWGASSPFTLPNTDGVTLQTTVFPTQLLLQINQVVGAGTTTSTSTTTTAGGNMTAAGTATAPLQPIGSILLTSLSCPTGCNASAITGKFAGLPASSWITVEWLDGFGVWQPVMGWQGTADFTDASGNLVKQFGVYQRNYGQGPF